MSAKKARQLIFWAALAVFMGWDWWYAPKPDLRNEPPVIAAGSGQVISGGHCSMAK